MARNKLHQLGSRILRAFTPIALSVSLIASGCDTVPQEPTIDDPVDQRASEDGLSVSILKNGEKIADAVVEDEAFAELVEVAAGVAGDLHDVQQKLSEGDLDAIAVTTTEPSFAGTMGPNMLLQRLGGDPKDLQHMRALIDELRENHQGLAKASPQEVRYVFELAFETDEANDLLDDAIADEISFYAVDPCEQLCHNIYTAAATIAVLVFVAEMALAAVTFPFGVLIAMWAVAQLNFALTLAQAERDQCIAACDGVIIDINVCGENDVCEDDEYCWKGVLGIGADECRPKKGQGRTCANHEQCQSGCCKLHVWTNPVSKTCRPASAC